MQLRKKITYKTHYYSGLLSMSTIYRGQNVTMASNKNLPERLIYTHAHKLCALRIRHNLSLDRLSSQHLRLIHNGDTKEMRKCNGQSLSRIFAPYHFVNKCFLQTLHQFALSLVESQHCIIYLLVEEAEEVHGAQQRQLEKKYKNSPHILTINYTYTNQPEANK